jgi:hypothetical protein
MKELYPVTIVQARYNGVYEGASWIAFYDTYNEGDLSTREFLDSEAFGGDMPCCEWWMDNCINPNIAVGQTPNEALEKLVEKQPIEWKVGDEFAYPQRYAASQVWKIVGIVEGDIYAHVTDNKGFCHCFELGTMSNARKL